MLQAKLSTEKSLAVASPCTSVQKLMATFPMALTTDPYKHALRGSQALLAASPPRPGRSSAELWSWVWHKSSDGWTSLDWASKTKHRRTGTLASMASPYCWGVSSCCCWEPLCKRITDDHHFAPFPSSWYELAGITSRLPLLILADFIPPLAAKRAPQLSHFAGQRVQALL